MGMAALMDAIAQEVDRKARLCVMASMLYYGLNVTMMPDTAYDQMAKYVSDNWKKLTPLRQWQLGTAEEIAASGFRAKVTLLAADACVDWMLRHGVPLSGQVTITRPWRMVRESNMRFLFPDEFTWRTQ